MTSASLPRTGEIPLVVRLLGFIPAVAVAVRVIDSLWMAAGVLIVMAGSAAAQALLETPAADPAGARENGIGREPDRAGPWLRALVVSSLLTAVFEALLLAVDPAASAALGIYAPLIAVNAFVVGGGGIPSPAAQPTRAPMAVLRSALAALGSAAWFSVGLVAVALVREVLGSGTITLFPAGAFGGTIVVSPLLDQPARALGLAGGGLLCLGYLAAAARAIAARKSEKAG